MKNCRAAKKRLPYRIEPAEDGKGQNDARDNDQSADDLFKEKDIQSLAFFLQPPENRTVHPHQPPAEDQYQDSGYNTDQDNQLFRQPFSLPAKHNVLVLYPI